MIKTFKNLLSKVKEQSVAVPGYKAKKNENINGVEVVRLKSIFEVRENVIFRMFSYISYVFSSFLYSKKKINKFDFCISIAPLPPGIVGALSQKLFKLTLTILKVIE